MKLRNRYLNEKLLKEHVEVEGAEYIDTAFGYDFFNITSYESAQQFIVDESEDRAGEAWTRNETTFNSNIQGDVKLYFVTKENTNKVILGILTGQGWHSISIQDKELNIYTNLLVENVDDEAVIKSNLNTILFTLIPGFAYKGKQGLVFNQEGNAVKGNYQGLLTKTELEADNLGEVELDDIQAVGPNSFVGYPAESVVLPLNVTTIFPNAFRGFAGKIKTPYLQIPEGWSSAWNPDECEVEWGYNLPEEDRERLNREREEREQQRIDAERARELEEAHQQLEYFIADIETLYDQNPQTLQAFNDADIDINELQSDFLNNLNEVAQDLFENSEQYVSFREMYDNLLLRYQTLVQAEQELQTAPAETVLRYKVIKNQICITGCKRGRKELNIPSEIDGKPVTSIDQFAFYENKKLTKVIIPDSVKVIGKAAFYHCSNITDLRYSKKTIVYSDAFNGIRSYNVHKI